LRASDQMAGVADVYDTHDTRGGDGQIEIGSQIGDDAPEPPLPGSVRLWCWEPAGRQDCADGVDVGPSRPTMLYHHREHRTARYHTLKRGNLLAETRELARALPNPAPPLYRCDGMADADDAAPIRLTTGDMAYGPHAVARHEGKVVFVRGAAPGDVVDAVITEHRRAFAFADTVGVVEPSDQRRTPPCPYLPRCGGCPWQHLTYEAQLAAKQRIVAEQLRRIAGLDLPVAPVLASPREFGCRRRIKLRVDGGAVGYYAAASHTLVPVEHCLLGEPAVDAAIASTVGLVRTLAAPLRRIELIARDGDSDRVVLAGEVEGHWVESDESRCRAWLAAHPQVQGLILHGRGWQRRWGDAQVEAAPEDDLALIAQAPVFTQANRLMNRTLVATVLRWVDPQPGQHVLDLYAGAGNFSLPLRRRGASVIAVEQNRQAAADAAANAERHPGAPMRVISARAERAVERLAAEGAHFDAVVLDPPRSGAAGCVPALLRLGAPRLVYVSCDPATLARDLSRLSGRYQVEAVQPLDLFPHTYHVETVVRATLSCGTRTPGVSSARRHESAEPSRRRRTRGRTS
jgi:23S rRNA (uracil1939-C5)-methyltransferase